MDEVEARFRAIFQAVHAGHPGCATDEWLSRPCMEEAGQPAARPIVWSRRNGAWRRSPILWIGAAPGNAGGKGAGELGAHATRIPFGGDISGANVDALLGGIGLDRNRTFIVAALNQLPARGGGEPTRAELVARVGRYPTSLHLLRDTIVAVGPTLVVTLGTVAARAAMAATALGSAPYRLPTATRLEKAGIHRGEARAWPDPTVDEAFLEAWRTAWGDTSMPHLLWLMHPSAQNMSPFAGTETAFHTRMLETRTALRRGVHEVLGWEIPTERPAPPTTGIYALPEWRERIGPRHERLDRLWREKGI